MYVLTSQVITALSWGSSMPSGGGIVTSQGVLGWKSATAGVLGWCCDLGRFVLVRRERVAVHPCPSRASRMAGGPSAGQGPGDATCLKWRFSRLSLEGKQRAFPASSIVSLNGGRSDVQLHVTIFLRLFASVGSKLPGYCFLWNMVSVGDSFRCLISDPDLVLACDEWNIPESSPALCRVARR